MDILKYVYEVHTPKTRELFGLVGEFCVDPVVRAELGAPISSQPGDVWLVAMDGGEVQGFCCITLQKNGKAKLHALYAPSAATVGSLRRTAVKEAKSVSANAITHIAQAAQSTTLEKEGWRAGTARGQYVTFEKGF